MNERDVAKGFSALWFEFFPMLSPTFIIAFNEAYVRPILGREGIVPRVAPQAAGIHHSDLLAEFGFRFAAAAHQAGIPVMVAAGEESIRNAANLAAGRRIGELRMHPPADALHLTGSEQEEGIRLAAVYEEFLTLWPTSELVTYSPHLLGSGVLNSCFADLAVGRTLFEVKTVTRHFQSRDLRQLLIYFALQAMTEDKRWEYGGLLNPRLGVFCTFSIDWLVMRLSGGRPPKLVLSDFMRALSRDSVLDRRF
jgi:hypothetical protein